MKKFFAEFKKFITRGNVLDMAVGVIVGGAFTGIVNGLSNYILKPIINAIIAVCLGADGLSGAVTPLRPVYTTDATTGEQILDLANSIYIDWGAFISAVINFFLIAIVLFCIVKTMNTLRDGSKKIRLGKYTSEQKKEFKKAGINIKDADAIKAYLDAKAAKEAEEKAAAEKAAAEKAAAERLANPTSEDLLKEIIQLLKNK